MRSESGGDSLGAGGRRSGATHPWPAAPMGKVTLKKVTITFAVMTVGVIASLGVASAAHASPWEFAGAYQTDTECVSAGQQGMAIGDWQEYVCALFEGQHDLYVRWG